MTRNIILAVVAGIGLSLSPMIASSQDQGQTSDTQVSNMFDASSWMSSSQPNTGGFDLSNLGAMFAAPQGVPKLDMATPNGLAAFMNPTTYAQMMNPAFYAQMMSPGFYTQFINPANWMSWLNPSAYSNWINPQTYLQAMNPLSYMQFMNPMSYLQWANLNNYSAFVNPATYTQWIDPSAYKFTNPAETASSSVNWFDPASWTKGLETSE